LRSNTKEGSDMLDRIDFKNCELPELWGCRADVRLKLGAIVITTDARLCVYRHSGNGARWLVCHGVGVRTFEELEELRAICGKVDKFIEAETARIKLEDEYPLSAAEASEFLRTHPGEHRFAWAWVDATGTGETSWRSYGWVFSTGFRYRLIESRNVPQEPDWVPVPWWEVEELQNKGVEVRYESRATGRFEKRSFPSRLASKVDNYVVDRHTLPAGYVPSFERWESKTADELLRMMMAVPGREFVAKAKDGNGQENVFAYEPTKGLRVKWNASDVFDALNQHWLFHSGPYKVKVS
jgi:hypothetical protein